LGLKQGQASGQASLAHTASPGFSLAVAQGAKCRSPAIRSSTPQRPQPAPAWRAQSTPRSRDGRELAEKSRCRTQTRRKLRNSESPPASDRLTVVDNPPASLSATKRHRLGRHAVWRCRGWPATGASWESRPIRPAVDSRFAVASGHWAPHGGSRWRRGWCVYGLDLIAFGDSRPVPARRLDNRLWRARSRPFSKGGARHRLCWWAHSLRQAWWRLSCACSFPAGAGRCGGHLALTPPCWSPCRGAGPPLRRRLAAAGVILLFGCCRWSCWSALIARTPLLDLASSPLTPPAVNRDANCVS